MIQLIQRATHFGQKKAVISAGQSFSYQQLLEDSKKVANFLLSGNTDLNEGRVAFLVAPGYNYVTLQWGIWRAGGIAVPLCEKHPLPSLQYVIEDAQVSVVLYSDQFAERLQPLMQSSDVQFIHLDQIVDKEGVLPDVAMWRRAMILYTSGTTGFPKGVVSTHFNIECQVKALVTSWAWSDQDHILNVLPMHHVHGIVNILSCALWSGAVCEFLPRFDIEQVFKRFLEGHINLFMAVPTIYYKLINYWEALPAEQQVQISQALNTFRLMVSGSAALPVSVLEKWRDISGQTLLERYGMTEMGMAISNPYDGERKPGFIGQPLPKVIVRIANEEDQEVEPGQSGEIQVKGPNIFKEYWGKPEATRDTFTDDGWFKTGDIAVYEDGSYRILGRNSVDIIKSGGYKISALEIEEVLRKHPQIKECGVVGIPDEEWGEIIGASLILTGEEPIDLEGLKAWLKERLPGYKTPRKYIFQDDLPRNVMGKVTKHVLKTMFD